MVSHDRWFLDRICTHILSFEGEGNVVFYEGSYSDYEEYKKARNGGKELPRKRYRKLMEWCRFTLWIGIPFCEH